MLDTDTLMMHNLRNNCECVITKLRFNIFSCLMPLTYLRLCQNPPLFLTGL